MRLSRILRWSIPGLVGAAFVVLPFMAYRCGMPPATPVVPVETVREFAGYCLAAYSNAKFLPGEARLAALAATTRGLYSGVIVEIGTNDARRYALFDDPAHALLMTLSRLKPMTYDGRGWVGHEVRLNFLGPRKIISGPLDLLWGVTVVPGLDGLRVEGPGTTALLLPEEVGLFTGGDLLSFLPVRFGVDRRTVMGILGDPRFQRWADPYHAQQQPRRLWKFTGSGLPRNPVERFRTASFHCTVDSKAPGGIRVVPLYRGAPLPATDVTVSDITNAARAAGDWFLRHQLKDGSFSYRYDPVRDVANASAYSYPRHAGSALILYRIAGLLGEARFLDAGDRAMLWFERSVRTNNGRACYLNNNRAELGAAALAALALFERRAATGKVKAPAPTPDNKTATAVGEGRLRAILAFLAWMQRADGSFRAYWDPAIEPAHVVAADSGRRADRKTAAMNFPGQALWAMAKGDKAFGGFMANVARGLDASAGFWSFPFSLYYVYPYSWEMQAVAELALSARKPAWVRFLFENSDSMLDSLYGKDAPFPDYVGGYGTPVFFAPLAHAAGFQGEGMAPAYAVARAMGDSARADKLRAALRLTAAFLLANQVGPEIAFRYPAPEKALGAFRAGPTDHAQQIDYTQHALAALLNMLEAGVFDGR